MTFSVNRLRVRCKNNCYPSLGIILSGNQTYPCLLGRNGISAIKREGDKKTPAGQWKLLYGMFRADRVKLPRTKLAMRAIQPHEAWCDASGHRNYNQRVRLPFDHSHEILHRQDALYDICLVMDYNISNRQRNRGSAVFFHLSAEKPYTAGCLAVSLKTMLRLLPFLRTGTIIDIEI